MTPRKLPVVLLTAFVLSTAAVATVETIELAPGILADRLLAHSGETLAITGVPLWPGAPLATLEVAPFRILAGDAVLVVHGEEGEQAEPFPIVRHFTGTVRGLEGSRVFLSVDGEGELRGIIDRGAEHWLLRDRGGDLELRAIDGASELPASARPFECDGSLEPPGSAVAPPEPLPLAAPPELPAAAPGHLARLAVETDFEYYSLFNNVTNAARYALDLLAYSSTVYLAEIDTPLLVSYLSLWTTASDPWTQTNTLCALLEYGRYWNDNRTSVQRTIVQMLSGKATGGGVAWRGVLCAGALSYDHLGQCPGLTPQVSNYAGGYSFVGAINGAFNPASPTVMWDSMATTHEIGHNFASRHTHCYAGIGGNPSEIDICYTGESGCYGGTTVGLPGLGTLLGGTPGTGTGTIMSYCHLLPPNYSNITFTFGLNHPYGVAANRVPPVMTAHVASAAATNPICLAFTLFANGFESGALVPPWSAKTP